MSLSYSRLSGPMDEALERTMTSQKGKGGPIHLTGWTKRRLLSCLPLLIVMIQLLSSPL